MPSLHDLYLKQKRCAEYYWQKLITSDDQFEQDWAQIRYSQEWLAAHMHEDSFLDVLCMQYCQQGWYRLAKHHPLSVRLSWAETASQAAEFLKDTESQITFLSLVGETYGFAGEYKRGLKIAQKALGLARRAKSQQQILQALHIVASAYVDLDDYDHAAKAYKESLEIAIVLDHPTVVGDILVGLADCYLGSDKYHYAAEYYKRALLIFEHIDDDLGIAKAVQGLGAALIYLNQAERGRDYLHRALRLTRRISDRNTETIVLRNLGIANEQLGNFKKALFYYEQCLMLAEEAGDRSMVSKARYGIGLVAIKQLELELNIVGIRRKLDLAKRNREYKKAEGLERQINWFYTLAQGSLALEGEVLNRINIELSMAMNLGMKDHDYESAIIYCERGLSLLKPDDPRVATVSSWLQEYRQKLNE